MPLVCVQWPRLGPPHVSRLRAAHRVLQEAGHDLVALETASDSQTYAWRVEQGDQGFRRVTAFEGRSYHDIPPATMHRQVVATLDRINPDAVLIHSYSTPDARAALVWTRRRRRIALCMAESRAEDAPRAEPRERIKRVIISQFDAALASGSASSRYIAELGLDPSRIALGYSVVDNAHFAERAAAVRRSPETAAHLPGLGKRSPFFLASARFMERKNLPALLRAYGVYHARARGEGVPPWRLILLGDGALRTELEGIVRDLRLSDVEMPGWRQIEDLPLYYGLASAFVHAAEVDQWGLVINEAMAAGLPVIVSTGTGATEDLVRQGVNGYTFAPCDEEALAGHLFRVAHVDDREALAEASRSLISAWPLERFGTGLLEAVRLGAPHADRGLSPQAALVLGGLRLAARSSRSFHAVEA
jgi:1,2-diacylglycerol 3-alpha-glucosyltransferase